MMRNLFKYLLLVFIAAAVTSCTKDVPPELLSNKQQKTPDRSEMPDDSIHRNLKPKDSFHGSGDGSESSGEKSDGMSDKEVVKYTSEADEADSKYQKSKSESDKEKCIEMQLKAANYLMFEANLPPRDKYKPALQRYRRVLELDPKNQEAMANKTEIEDIYKSMGKPIPN